MEWIASLRGKTVGLDTAPIIYFIEGNPLYVDMMRSFFQAVQKMATAVFGGASFFLTNDTRLPSLPNLKTLVLEDLKKGSEG